MAEGHEALKGAVAAIDCGTNSTRLLVEDAEGRVLERQMRVTRLGEGVDAAGRLAPEAVERTLEVLRDYRRRMDELEVRAARLAATSAARDAIDAARFLDAVEQVTGVRPEVLSGEEEGRLSFAGATASLPPGMARSEPLLVVDVGGGSTELVVGRPEAPAQAVARSVDVGCVRVTERFFAHDPPAVAEIEAAQRAVTALVEEARGELPVLAPGGTLVGLAGTVSTLAALRGAVPVYSREALHHQVLARAEVERWYRRLAAEDCAARLGRPGMIEGRSDVIVGGALVLWCVMRAFDAANCLVSEDDILDGLAAGLRAGGR